MRRPAVYGVLLRRVLSSSYIFVSRSIDTSLYSGNGSATGRRVLRGRPAERWTRTRVQVAKRSRRGVPKRLHIPTVRMAGLAADRRRRVPRACVRRPELVRRRGEVTRPDERSNGILYFDSIYAAVELSVPRCARRIPDDSGLHAGHIRAAQPGHGVASKYLLSKYAGV